MSKVITKAQEKERDAYFVKQEARPDALSETGRKEIYRIGRMIIDRLDFWPSDFQRPISIYRFEILDGGMNVYGKVRGREWSCGEISEFTEQNWPEDCYPTNLMMELEDRDNDWSIALIITLEDSVDCDWVSAKAVELAGGHGDPKDIEAWIMVFKLIYELE